MANPTSMANWVQLQQSKDVFATALSIFEIVMEESFPFGAPQMMKTTHPMGSWMTTTITPQAMTKLHSSGLSASLQQVLLDALSNDPKKRPTAAEFHESWNQ